MDGLIICVKKIANTDENFMTAIHNCLNIPIVSTITPIIWPTISLPIKESDVSVSVDNNIYLADDVIEQDEFKFGEGDSDPGEPDNDYDDYLSRIDNVRINNFLVIGYTDTSNFDVEISRCDPLIGDFELSISVVDGLVSYNYLSSTNSTVTRLYLERFTNIPIKEISIDLHGMDYKIFYWNMFSKIQFTSHMMYLLGENGNKKIYALYKRRYNDILSLTVLLSKYGLHEQFALPGELISILYGMLEYIHFEKSGPITTITI